MPHIHETNVIDQFPTSSQFTHSQKNKEVIRNIFVSNKNNVLSSLSFFVYIFINGWFGKVKLG